MNRILSLTRNFWRYRHLLLQMTAQEIKGQFAGSFGGVLWSVGHPMISFLVYLLVFVHIFKMRAPEYGGDTGFALYMMAGLFPWTAFSEGFLRSTSSVFAASNLIKKSVFPSEVLVAKSVLAPFVANGFALLILAGYMAVTRGNLAIFFLLPVLVVFQIVFTMGFGFLSASLSPFFRDMIQIVDVAMRFWIFLSPILYPMSLIPPWGQTLMWFNPIYPLITLYHDAFLLGRVESIGAVAALFTWTVVMYSFGGFVFSKLKDEFADWI